MVFPMKLYLAFVLTLLSLNAFAGNPYPKGPDLQFTPGSLCTTPDSYRYPEKIPYCERELNSAMKEFIFIKYRKLGFSLSGDRGQYKVDHFIPLCAGGSNNEDNLWPQYYTISQRTDLIETRGCEVLAKGRISQKDLIELIMKAKLDLKAAPEVLKQLNKLI